MAMMLRMDASPADKETIHFTVLFLYQAKRKKAAQIIARLSKYY
jgi:2'-5' RNA ligase